MLQKRLLMTFNLKSLTDTDLHTTQPGEGDFALASGSLWGENMSRWKTPITFRFSCVSMGSLQAWETLWATTLKPDMENLSVQAGNFSSILLIL